MTSSEQPTQYYCGFKQGVCDIASSRPHPAPIEETLEHQHDHYKQHPAPANPCEENGCTDIENCDEICEHMRIYSPAYVREKTRKAREESQQRIDALEKGLTAILNECDSHHNFGSLVAIRRTAIALLQAGDP